MNGALARLVVAAALIGPLIGGCTAGGIVSSEDYAVQYDYAEFRVASDGGDFPVIIMGNPFPDLGTDEAGRRLLASMQANRPRSRMTFALAATTPAPSRPAYRLLLVFDPAHDVIAGSVCRGGARVGPHAAGRISVLAVYCRNDLPLSQAVGRTAATGPDDPAVGRLFRHVFLTVFSDAPIVQPDHGYPGGLQ